MHFQIYKNLIFIFRILKYSSTHKQGLTIHTSEVLDKLGRAVQTKIQIEKLINIMTVI